jgi:ribosomal protein L4
VKHTNGYGLNIYDILRHEQIVISKRAVEEVERILGA